VPETILPVTTVGQEKAEILPVTVVPKRIPVRSEKAARPVLPMYFGIQDKEVVRKLLATTAEIQQPVWRNSGNTRKFSQEQEP
jgi:hypothetical protein